MKNIGQNRCRCEHIFISPGLGGGAKRTVSYTQVGEADFAPSPPKWRRLKRSTARRFPRRHFGGEGGVRGNAAVGFPWPKDGILRQNIGRKRLLRHPSTAALGPLTLSLSPNNPAWIANRSRPLFPPASRGRAMVLFWVNSSIGKSKFCDAALQAGRGPAPKPPRFF